MGRWRGSKPIQFGLGNEGNRPGSEKDGFVESLRMWADQCAEGPKLGEPSFKII